MTTPEDDKEVTQDIHPPAPAALSARYDLLGELGRGGMGIVYKARDKETGGVVALKVLQAEIAARPDVIERFKSELLLARKITHKNVCRTHELLRFGDTVVISMEYVEGESLRAVVKRFGGVPLRRGLEWTAQICSALTEAHAQGVVHRDLKPENILIARDGSAKVMDFGIARSLEPQATATAMATIIGTPAYMSPEQAEGKPVDHRTDIYSLGLVLYEMFTGRPAFQSDTPIGMLTARLQEAPPLPSSVEPDLPDRIDRAIQKCLERKPEKRFQSATDLEAALSKRPQPRAVLGEAGAVPLPLHLTRWQRADWLLLPLAAAGLLLFFSFFEGSSLAPRTPIAFERAALPRIAQEYAQRLGAPVGRDYRITVIPAPRRYEYLATTAGAPAALELANNPVPYWGWAVDLQHPDRQPTVVLVDNHGSLVTFIRDFPSGSGSQRIPLEEAQALASRVLRDSFNREASQLLSSSAGPD
ncbi:MAG: serine/threonine-protein kinase, partial [Candidatus Acidiferrales bacterium]